jgi:hypothetical protein
MATEILQAGVALPVVSRRLDNRRGSTALNCYTHAVSGGDADAARVLRSVLTAAAR